MLVNTTMCSEQLCILFSSERYAKPWVPSFSPRSGAIPCGPARSLPRRHHGNQVVAEAPSRRAHNQGDGSGSVLPPVFLNTIISLHKLILACQVLCFRKQGGKAQRETSAGELGRASEQAQASLPGLCSLPAFLTGTMPALWPVPHKGLPQERASAIASRNSWAFWRGEESFVHSSQSASEEAAYFNLPGARPMAWISICR